jgi:hypothetical protein
MSIMKWSVVGCALTLGTYGLTVSAALASDASADVAAARAFHGGSTTPVSDAGRRDDPVSSGVGAEERVPLGASDGAADRPMASASGAPRFTLASPTGSVAGAAKPSGPLGAGDASSDALVARARPVRAVEAEVSSYAPPTGNRR